MNTSRASMQERAPEKSTWWRTVLGEYPTGVTLVTSRGAEGDDAGMVVGTFTAISEHPPLIGFLPQSTSYTAKLIQENGTFCANVLGYGHEDLCRAFATKDEQRFAKGSWERSEAGNARLTDAVAWFEGRISQTVPLGDHDLIVAEVTGLGVGDGSAGLPLLFLKGGYGSFTVPSLSFDLSGFTSRMRVADAIRDTVQELADETGTECLLSTLADDSVVVLTAANLLPHRPRLGLVGMAFPFAAPMASVLAAWGDDARRTVWRESSRHLLGRVNRSLLQQLLASVRARGYAISVGSTMAERFDQVTDSPNSTRADLAELWRAIDADIERTLDPELTHSDVSSIQVPVFDANGQSEFELVVSGLPGEQGSPEFQRIVGRALAAADRLTELGGGRRPERSPLDE